MKIRKAIIVLLVLAMVLCITACDKEAEGIDAAELYKDIYQTAEGSLAGLDTKKQIMKCFEEAGLSAVDSNNQINMVNWEVIEEFCYQASKAGKATATVYVINDDGSYTQYDLQAANGDLNIKQKVVTGGEEPEITYENQYEAAAWKYTEKGYLFFEADHPTGDFEPWLETCIRVKPMDDDLRQLTRDYISVMGYEDNNLFIGEWNEKDYSVLELYDIYELVSADVSGETKQIPAAEFEGAIQQYLNISVEQIRSKTEYNAETDTYTFTSRNREAMGSTPDMPYPEVVSYNENSDGTITMTVEAVWPKYKNDTAYIHEVIVRPSADGDFKYVSNTVIENVLETSWYVSR